MDVLDRTPFDLSQAPLLRVHVLTLAQDTHWLVLSMHRLIADGWSLGILMQEMWSVYIALVTRSKASPLPPLTIETGDVAHWQASEWGKLATVERVRGYWKKQLANMPASLNMPYSKNVESTQPSNSYPFAFTPELSDMVRQFSGQNGVTAFMTLMALFQALLHRYTGQTDIIVGTPTTNRIHTETEKLIGNFVNPLPIRAWFTPDMNFKQLLTQVRNSALAALDHRELAFADMVALVDEPANQQNPIFPVMFAVQDAPMRLPDVPDLALHYKTVGTSATALAMQMELWQENGQFVGQFVYDGGLFNVGTIKRFLHHYQTLLKNATSYPQQPIHKLNFLTSVERQQLLVEWNDTAAPYPAEQTIHGLFEAQAEATPTAIAFRYNGAVMSYKELNDRANQIAHFLRSLGVREGTHIGIAVSRSPLMVAGLLGILKAGGAYVPLDPNYPRERLAYMIRDANVRFLITESVHLSALPNLDGLIPKANIIQLDDDFDQILDYETSNLFHDGTPDSRIYIIYTSGSTGKPKGVVAHHRGAVNRCQWMWRRYPFTPDEICCQKTTL
ncbi:MAG: AMP-binding protein, partial [Methylococcales bacterium]|nr:AMP-binding protein [Methylococcales bacterium]